MRFNAAKVYLALVFVSGAVFGGIAMQLYNARDVRGFNPADARKRYAEEMRTRLRLTAQQSQQLEEIFKTTHERYRALREKYQPEVKLIQEDHAERIRQMLSETQRREYEKMRQEREMHRQRSGGPPPPGGPPRGGPPKF